MKIRDKHHLNRATFLMGVLLSATVFAAELGPDDFTVSSHAVFIVGPDGENQTLNSLTPEARADFMRGLRALLGSSNYEYRKQAIQALLVLKDDEGIKRIAAMYHGDDAGSASQSFAYMLDFGNGAIIPYLISDVYEDHGKMLGVWPSPAKIKPGQIEDFIPPAPLKLESATLILKCIMNSEEFPAGAKSWAHDLTMDLNGATDPVANAVYNQLKEWWEHNKDAINAKQYDKATWQPKEKIDVKALNKGPANSE